MDKGCKTLSDLLVNSEYELINGTLDIELFGLAYNSNKVKKGFGFVAIKGEKTDGHQYITNAIESGARTIFCEAISENIIKKYTNVTFVKVSNSRKLLAEMANAFYDYPSEKLKLIGITGTNGKTTCTFLFKHMIENSGYKCGIIGTTGIFINDREIPATHTTPESLELYEILADMRDEKVEYVIMEVSSHSLVQFRVYGLNFVMALFTNLTHDHLDYHKTMESYASAKKILFESLSSDSWCLVNSDSEWHNFMISDIECKNVVKVGRNEQSNFRIVNEKMSLDGISYDLVNTNQSFSISSILTGRFNIDNSAIVIIACIILGIDANLVSEYIKNAEGAPGRMQRVLLNNGAIGLVDYAHTPDALEKAILSSKAILDKEKSSHRLICVFGCGGDRDKTKRPEMGKISTQLADLTIITSDNPRTENDLRIIDDILAGVDKESDFVAISDRRKAIEYAYSKSQHGDVILVAGKGHEKYQIIGNQKFHFDDVEELEKFS
ncbi:UDP-N-acetylmuramoyl-L-alanyl-D-glutamate--2,6-diaminopimelate ligase [Candidatus Kapaibacterium sp.]